MRRRTAWRVRNNPLEIDLFERSLQTPKVTETDTTEIDSTFDPIEPVEMAQNDEVNARKCLSDYFTWYRVKNITELTNLGN